MSKRTLSIVHYGVSDEQGYPVRVPRPDERVEEDDVIKQGVIKP